MAGIGLGVASWLAAEWGWWDAAAAGVVLLLAVCGVVAAVGVANAVVRWVRGGEE